MVFVDKFIVYFYLKIQTRTSNGSFVNAMKQKVKNKFRIYLGRHVVLKCIPAPRITLKTFQVDPTWSGVRIDSTPDVFTTAVMVLLRVGNYTCKTSESPLMQWYLHQVSWRCVRFIKQDEQCTCNVTSYRVSVGTETQQYVLFVLLLQYM
jgi:hypothetical protein